MLILSRLIFNISTFLKTFLNLRIYSYCAGKVSLKHYPNSMMVGMLSVVSFLE